MKPTDLEKLLNVAPSTLRRWAGSEYAEFLSATGKGRAGAARSFNDRDARILSWVAVLKAAKVPPLEIIDTLRKAQTDNWQELPPLRGIDSAEPVELIPREALVERDRVLREQYALVVKERDDLIRRLEQERQENRATVERLQTRIIELTAQEAELRGKWIQEMSTGHRQRIQIFLVVMLIASTTFIILSVFLLLQTIAHSGAK